MKGLLILKTTKWLGVNVLGLVMTWFMSIDLENLEWTKWPATMGLSTLIYFIYNFYNAKKINDREDFKSTSAEMKELINILKETNKDLLERLDKETKENDLLRKEILDLKVKPFK